MCFARGPQRARSDLLARRAVEGRSADNSSAGGPAAPRAGRRWSFLGIGCALDRGRSNRSGPGNWPATHCDTRLPPLHHVARHSWPVPVRFSGPPEERLHFFPRLLASRECKDLIELFAQSPTPVDAKVIVPLLGHLKIRLGRRAKVVWASRRPQDILKQVNPPVQCYSHDDARCGGYAPLQIARYEAGGLHWWHRDSSVLAERRRRWTVICQLSESTDYQGGDLLFYSGRRIVTAPREIGSVCLAPSRTWHRVGRVAAGVRYSATMWLP